MRLWDAATGKELAVLKHTDNVKSVAFSPDGRRLASTSRDKTVRLWDAASGKELDVLQGHTDEVHHLAFSPDGRRLASASFDKTVRFWDTASGKELAVLQGHTDEVHHVTFSPDGRRLASASRDNTVRLWDAASGKELDVLQGHTGIVYRLADSPDGRRLASASRDNTVRLWDAATGKELAVLKGHTSDVSHVSWSPDGRRLASASSDKTVRFWISEETPEEWEERARVAWETQRKRDRDACQAQSELDEEEGEWLAAAFNLGRMLYEEPRNAELHDRLGRILAEQGRWPEAVAAYARARQLEPEKPYRWYRQGLALLNAGDEVSYREFCAAMLDEFQDTKDADTADNVAYLVAHRPNSVDPEGQKHARTLARMAVTSNPKSWGSLENLGAMNYRTGDFSAAHRHLEEAIKQLTEKESPTVWMQLFLAMTRHQLGNKAKAKSYLDKATKQIDADLKKAVKEQPSWEERLRRQLLRREAEELLGGKGNGPPKP